MTIPELSDEQRRRRGTPPLRRAAVEPRSSSRCAPVTQPGGCARAGRVGRRGRAHQGHRRPPIAAAGRHRPGRQGDGAAGHRAQPPASRPRPAPDRRPARGVRARPPAAEDVTLVGLTVVSGRPRLGKGTVVARLAAEHPGDLRLRLGHHPAAATGRSRRRALPVRLRGRFDAMIADGELLEWAVVHGITATGPRGDRCSRRWPRAGRLCWRSICRGLARCGRTAGRDFRVPGPAVLGGAGPAAEGRGTESAAERERGWPRREPSWRPSPSSTTWW